LTNPEEDFSEYGDKSLEHLFEVTSKRIMLFQAKLLEEQQRWDRVLDEKLKRQVGKERRGKVAD